MIAANLIVSGRVQGVGFRWWAYSVARELGLVGHATNLPDGRVEIRAQGEVEAVHRMIRLAVEDPSTTARPGRVDDFDLTWAEVDDSVGQFRYF